MKKLKFQLGPTLKRLLDKSGQSRRELSKVTGISASTLHHWMENRQPRNIEQAQLLATHFGVSLHYLFFGVDEMKKEQPNFVNENNPLLGIALDAISNDGVKLLLDFKIKKL